MCTTFPTDAISPFMKTYPCQSKLVITETLETFRSDNVPTISLLFEFYQDRNIWKLNPEQNVWRNRQRRKQTKSENRI